MVPEDGVFSKHNQALFEAIRKVSGKDLIVDSSKDVNRMKRLTRLDGFEIHPIHLVRSIYGGSVLAASQGTGPVRIRARLGGHSRRDTPGASSPQARAYPLRESCAATE